jgi:hypothetical protein
MRFSPRNLLYVLVCIVVVIVIAVLIVEHVKVT